MLSIRHLLCRFAQLDSRRRAQLLEAAVWLLLARIGLAVIPFPRLARALGTFVPPTDVRAVQAKSKGELRHVQLAEEIAWTVTAAARHVPFKAVCLPQAMAAKIMLKRRGVSSVMHFGAAKGKDRPLDTHAWLDAAGVEVTGYPVAKHFADIACFV